MSEIINIISEIPIEQILSTSWDQKFYDSLKYITQANKIVHGDKNGAGIGKTTKMNCYSWGIPTSECKTGRILSKDPDNSCHGCYAKRGNYMYDGVKKCLQKRFQQLSNPNWSEAIAFLINKKNPEKGQFRWFDSGDLQGHDHLIKIILVCLHTPQVKHWLPTQEHELILEHVLGGWEIPENLTIRLSARKLEGTPPISLARYLNSFVNVRGFVGTSSVGRTKAWKSNPGKCPSSLQENNCGKCTKCWLPVENIMYRKH